MDKDCCLLLQFVLTAADIYIRSERNVFQHSDNLITIITVQCTLLFVFFVCWTEILARLHTCNISMRAVIMHDSCTQLMLAC